MRNLLQDLATNTRTDGRPASALTRKAPMRLSATIALTYMVMSMGRKDMGKRMRENRESAVYLRAANKRRTTGRPPGVVAVWAAACGNGTSG